MIDQLPENRTLPDDVRLRARRRLAEGMNPAPGNRAPLFIAAGVSVLAAGAVVASQALFGESAEVAGPSYQQNGEFAGKDRAVVNHVERGVVAPDALARCVAAAKAHPPAAQWQTIATSRKDGTVLTAFRGPTGVFFCANTATTTTISDPDPAQLDVGRRKVKILFTSPTGAMAGLVSPDVKFLSLSRMAEPEWNNTSPALVDGLFLAPHGYLRAENGTKALVNGEESAVRGVPKPAPSVTDRPLPPADRGTPEAQKLAECLRDRPIPDPGQFAHGLTVKVSVTDTVVLGRFGDLLLYCLDAGGPLRGSVYDVRDPDGMDEVAGTTVASVRVFYDFRTQQGREPGEVAHSASSSCAAVGLVTDPRVASITYTRPGMADVPASIGNGTFVLAAPLIDQHPDARVVVRDAGGAILETITPTR
ncbi:hypothetical protein [Lentzea flava]|uniref:Uncharacterized protein n=1 Tax=Lentzea flava TaxID=103732 RepID=A0ABQ2U9U6_9PSEU|nr:hypothetical protein [Lentzea flava]MCP2196923.1 hypothetical protein [Lentzea flava]GGU14507.1 hypothetical protein GCM10010178_02420 [Lentzea flava]